MQRKQIGLLKDFQNSSNRPLIWMMFGKQQRLQLLEPESEWEVEEEVESMLQKVALVAGVNACLLALVVKSVDMEAAEILDEIPSEHSMDCSACVERNAGVWEESMGAIVESQVLQLELS